MTSNRRVDLVAAAVATAIVLSSGQLWAQARPNEQDLFGGSAAPPAPSAPKPVDKPAGAGTSEPPAAEASGTARDQAMLGNPGAGPQLSADVAPENPLTIGGQLYLRAQTTARENAYPDNWSVAAPNLMDVFLDARPNERVRAYILGRMSFDPTVPVGGSATLSPTAYSTFAASRGPNALLDQMWIAFDVQRRLFITAGKQHVKWGTGRFWTPTDYLHPVKRSPLDVFDPRGGVTMLKLQLPWEEHGWNFYGFAVLENGSDATATLGQIAGAARAELIILGAELGLDVFARRGEKPRFGVDLSTGLGDFDVYVDAGIRYGADFIRVTDTDPAEPMLPLRYRVDRYDGVKTQLTTGLTYSRKYNDNDVLTIGAEYFYNQVGLANRELYPGLFDNNTGQIQPINFFYLGRHYGALFLSLPAPYSWNYTTFTLSTLGNLSDRTFVSRLDYSVTLLTHLSLQAFAALHYGVSGGEFRFVLPASVVASPSPMLAPFINSEALRNAPVVDVGLALRLRI